MFNAKNADTIEYFIASINFEPHDLYKQWWSYNHWYERTPVYVLFLHIVHRQLIIQILLSSLGCALMFKMNKTAGLLWMFYLQEIIYSFNYNKECILLFSVILAIYLFQKKKHSLIIILPLLFSGFVSYGGVVASTHAYTHGLMLNFWKLWQPSFNVTIGYGKIFVYLQALPYCLAMLYFIRHIRLMSVETTIFVFLSLLYGSIYAEPRYRELFMPLLILFVAEPLKSYLKKLSIKSVKQYATSKLSEVRSAALLANHPKSFRPVSVPVILLMIKSLTSKL